MPYALAAGVILVLVDRYALPAKALTTSRIGEQVRKPCHRSKHRNLALRVAAIFTLRELRVPCYTLGVRKLGVRF